MTKILCIEDNREFFLFLSSVLRDFELSIAETLSSAFELLRNPRNKYDLILLDVSLPDGNGIKELGRLRDSMNSRIVPVVVLSADEDILTKVAAFGLGADDYVLKPPNAMELRARIDARLRNVKILKDSFGQLQIGNLWLDFDRSVVELRDKHRGKISYEMTQLEIKLLKILAGSPGIVFSRSDLIEKVWGPSVNVTERTVDAHISHIRKKIELSSVSIRTVQNSGYKIEIKDTQRNLEKIHL